MAKLKLVLLALVVVCLCSLSFMLGRMAGKPRCPSYHSRSFKFSSFTSSLDAGNSTALQSKLLNQDKRRFPANQNQTRERNSTSSKNKNGKLGASPLQNSSLRILLLTAMTANKIEEYQQATNSKQCYALKHGYTFIVETNSEMAKNINPWWFKVYAIQKYLPFFDWVIWLDGDCLVSNPDIKFEWFLDDPTADLVLTDHNFAVNNGVFALRRTEWSQEFLHKWLGAGQMVHAGGARWWQDDQGAMFHMLVAQGNQSYDGHCALREKCCSDVLEDCFREGMKAGGHPYLGRRVPKVRFISPKSHYVAETGASIRGRIVFVICGCLSNYVVWVFCQLAVHCPLIQYLLAFLYSICLFFLTSTLRRVAFQLCRRRIHSNRACQTCWIQNRWIRSIQTAGFGLGNRTLEQ